MSLRVDARKTELIDKVAEQTRRRLGASNAAAGAAAEAFVRRFYANVAVDDVIAFSPEDLYGAAIALWQFGRSRKKGLAKVRVYNPRLAEHGWASPHTIVEIINDDMPFLVDSVSVEMTRRELGVHLLIHPIVHVERDGSGALKGVAEAGSARNAGESFMHIEIDRQGGAETLAELQRAIESVLVDVRVTVADWKDMTARAREVITELKDRPPPLDAEEVKTAHDFLTWMADDHFTFLGYREYEFSGKGGKARANVVPGRGLGLCHDDEFVIFEGLRNLAALPPDVQEFVRQPTLLKITKANRRSTVHRAVHLDTIGVKKFDAAGNVTGERLFLGLFTSAAYSQSPLAIPLLADKVRRLVARAGFTSKSHDGKALLHILETFSRNELFQASEDELFEMAIGILHLQDRQRTALFVRKDAFERFVSCFVYVPRDRYTTELRLRFQKIIEKAFNGTQAAFSSHFPDDTALVRVHIVIKTTPGKIPSYDLAEINRLLMEASRGFIDRLKETLIEAHGEERGLAVFRRFAGAFPTAYRERFDPQSAAEDIGKIEEVLGDATSLALNLYRPLDAAEHELRFRIFRKGQPVPLSGVLPMLENMGLKAISESPYQIAPTGGEPVWMHDFALVAPEVAEIDLSSIKPNFEDCFARIWGGTVESDGFNRLVIGAGLSAREVTVLRAYARYLRQVGIPFSQAYMEDTLARNPKVVRRLVDLFVCVHNPAAREKIEVKSAGLIVEIEHLFDEVTNLDEDRILRRFLNLVRATLRTNFFQTGPDGQPKPYLALKIDSQAVDEMPLPRPLVEIFVYSPQVEGIHLRGGRVARGGIRWSDRREDFRTEILGLMKAQMVKNTVIVPVGSKGGFFVKRPAPADAGREAVLAEGIACYKIFIRGLLDLTDNIAPSANVPPKDVVRRDSDDPYLVVAADKGTATFSDIANGVSREYGFWLDDAFASGGSAGYDHKGMGITARGAWEAVKRHFREFGHDSQSQDFTVVGVGDMSGDVFGNGMLYSSHTKLVVAFDHRHIFIDPEPDPAASFAERERLFKLSRSSWADYDAKLISPGGGVFDRKAKSVKITPQIKARFGIAHDQMTPAELIKALLTAEVDLLWLGGIGTYVKASGESNAEAGDRANDALRVDARSLRARVVGEGANLGVTQRGRIEYAQKGAGGKGGRINTDAIDNSAGVDTSDHEVNIKILLGDVVARGDMTVKQRDKLLASMTDEVAALVLRDNYLQTQALSVAEAEGGAGLDRHIRLMRNLEKAGKLNRAIEFLPDDEEIVRRQAAGRGLTRPEIAVLLAYSKLTLYDWILASDLLDDDYLAGDLVRYFPAPLQKNHREAIFRHRLRREIVATVVTNSVINRTGPGFVSDLRERTGAAAADVARAYIVARQVFGLRPLWTAIEGLDNKVPAGAQYRMLVAINAVLDRAVMWFLRRAEGPIDIAATVERFEKGVAALKAGLAKTLDPAREDMHARRTETFAADGVPKALAAEIAGLDDLVTAPDIVRIAEASGKLPVDGVARVYFAVGARLGLDWLRDAAGRIEAVTAWQKRAVEAVIDDFYAQQSEFAGRALAMADGKKGLATLADSWADRHKSGLLRIDVLLGDLKKTTALDIAALTVAGRELRAFDAG